MRVRMYNSIPVGLGEIKFSDDPKDVLVAYGLGSCIGVSVYDTKIQKAGLLHAVLPENNNNDPLSTKFVDSGIKVLMDEFRKNHADMHRVIVKIVGGSNMLVANGLTFDIGERNIQSTKAALKTQNIAISAEEVGGNIGRTMRIYVEDGRVTVRSLRNPEKEI